MYISNRVVFLFALILIFFLSDWLTLLFKLPIGLSYRYFFLIVFSILFLLFFAGLTYLNLKNEWYRQRADYSFYTLKEVYKLYRRQVLLKKMTYQRFIEDYELNNEKVLRSFNERPILFSLQHIDKKRIITQVICLLRNRQDLVEKYFILENFKYSDYLNLIKKYNTTEIENKEEHKDGTYLKMQVINFIITSRKTKGTQTLGDRLFGYYLKSKGLISLTLSQCQEEWDKLIKEHNPIDNCRYIKTPDDFRQESDILATINNLQKIEEFFIVNNELTIIEVIKRDIKKLQEVLI